MKKASPNVWRGLWNRNVQWCLMAGLISLWFYRNTHTHTYYDEEGTEWHLAQSWAVLDGHKIKSKAGGQADGIGQSAPQGTLRVRRASVLGAVDHDLSVDSRGSGARRWGGSCRELRTLSRHQRVVFFSKWEVQTSRYQGERKKLECRRREKSSWLL